jgi:hypothetical protein
MDEEQVGQQDTRPLPSLIIETSDSAMSGRKNSSSNDNKILGTERVEIAPGVLNPAVRALGNKSVPNLTVSGGSMRAIKQATLDYYTEDITKNTGPYRGIVLMVLPDINGNDGNRTPKGSWLHSAYGDSNTKREKPSGTFKRYIVQIPELHSHLPRVNLQNLPPYDPNKTHPEYKNIFLYPEFIARTSDAPSANAGDIVIVDFGNRSTFQDPFYITKVSDSTTPAGNLISAIEAAKTPCGAVNCPVSPQGELTKIQSLNILPSNRGGEKEDCHREVEPQPLPPQQNNATTPSVEKVADDVSIPISQTTIPSTQPIVIQPEPMVQPTFDRTVQPTFEPMPQYVFNPIVQPVIEPLGPLTTDETSQPINSLQEQDDTVNVSNASDLKIILACGLTRSKSFEYQVSLFKKGLGSNYNVLPFRYDDKENLISAAKKHSNSLVVMYSYSGKYYSELVASGVLASRIMIVERFFKFSASKKEDDAEQGIKETIELLNSGGYYIAGDTLGTGLFDEPVMSDLIKRFNPSDGEIDKIKRIYLREDGKKNGFNRTYANHFQILILAGQIIQKLLSSMNVITNQVQINLPSPATSEGQVGVGTTPIKQSDTCQETKTIKQATNLVPGIFPSQGAPTPDDLIMTPRYYNLRDQIPVTGKKSTFVSSDPLWSDLSGAHPKISGGDKNPAGGRSRQDVAENLLKVKKVFNALGIPMRTSQMSVNIKLDTEVPGTSSTAPSDHYGFHDAHAAYDMYTWASSLNPRANVEICHYVLEVDRERSKIQGKAGDDYYFIAWARSSYPAGTSFGDFSVENKTVKAAVCKDKKLQEIEVTSNFVNITNIFKHFGFGRISNLSRWAADPSHNGGVGCGTARNIDPVRFSEWHHFQWEQLAGDPPANRDSNWNFTEHSLAPLNSSRYGPAGWRNKPIMEYLKGKKFNGTHWYRGK